MTRALTVEAALTRLRAADPARGEPALSLGARDVLAGADREPRPGPGSPSPSRFDRGVRAGGLRVRRLVVLAGAAVLIAVTALVTIPADHSLRTPAYAVTQGPNGTVHFSYDEDRFFTPGDATRIESALKDAGLPARVMIGSQPGTCADAPVRNIPSPGLVTAMTVHNGVRDITFHPSAIPDGATMLMVMAPEPLPNGGRLNTFFVTRHIPSCVDFPPR